MKKILLAIALIMNCMINADAQDSKKLTNSEYYLPLTVLRIAVQVEKTTFTPGECAKYADKYVTSSDLNSDKNTVSYAISAIKMQTEGQADYSKRFSLSSSILKNNEVRRDSNGVLLAINAMPKANMMPKKFVRYHNKPAMMNPASYLSDDIIAEQSMEKKAQLVAQALQNCRDKRRSIEEGKAEFMPKDKNEQAKTLDELNKKEAALMQMFNGYSVKDTTETIYTFIPSKEDAKKLLFRFSYKKGLADTQDTEATPYYISVEDEHYTPTIQTSIDDPKAKKESSIFINLPGKIKVSLQRDSSPCSFFELYAAQFGHAEKLDGSLFADNCMTHLVLNPVTGNVESIQTEMRQK
jgi:hypothetical protein